MAFVQGRIHKELATVPLSDAPIPKIGEVVELSEGIGIAVTTFSVTQVTYDCRGDFMTTRGIRMSQSFWEWRRLSALLAAEWTGLAQSRALR